MRQLPVSLRFKLWSFRFIVFYGAGWGIPNTCWLFIINQWVLPLFCFYSMVLFLVWLRRLQLCVPSLKNVSITTVNHQLIYSFSYTSYFWHPSFNLQSPFSAFISSCSTRSRNQTPTSLPLFLAPIYLTGCPNVIDLQCYFPHAIALPMNLRQLLRRKPQLISLAFSALSNLTTIYLSMCSVAVGLLPMSKYARFLPLSASRLSISGTLFQFFSTTHSLADSSFSFMYSINTSRPHSSAIIFFLWVV